MNKDFFLNPTHNLQRRYEALRSFFVDGLSAKDVADCFGYTLFSFYSLTRDFKQMNPDDFFKSPLRGPKEPYKQNAEIHDKVIALRKKNYSTVEIQGKLIRGGNSLSISTISSILRAEGFARLFRRTRAERIETLSSDRYETIISQKIEFTNSQTFHTIFGGVFIFIPLILQLEIDILFEQSKFYGSKQIPTLNFLLSYLALKLLGRERLSHINDFNFDFGLGCFAGLNVLPKSTAITQYSYRHDEERIRAFIQKFVKQLIKQGFIKGKIINLDFHPIPFYGEEGELEGNWIATRGKRMKSVLCFLAQDLETTYLCYSHADILRKEASDEILKFVDFYQQCNRRLPEMLVFDSKVTTLKNMGELNSMGIGFITLRKRGKSLLKKIESIENWQKIILDNVKRKYRNLRVYTETIKIDQYGGELTQVFVTGNGREFPMILLTNRIEIGEKNLLQAYAQRWRIENNIQENVDFFNLNALSSPVVVKVDFDVCITLIANSLYKLLSSGLRRFEKAKPKKLFRNFIESPARLHIENKKIIIKFEKKSFNPLIRQWLKNQTLKPVPWLGNRTLIYEFD